MNQIKQLLAAVVLVSAGAAHAQVQVQLNFPLPGVRFVAPPPVVMVEPGIQVVEDYDEEVFIVDGSYWVRRDNRWYRSPDHRGGWVIAPPPPRLVVFAPGRYRRYRHMEIKPPHRDNGHNNGHHNGKR